MLKLYNNGNVHFRDGVVLKTAKEAMYLGNELNKEVNINHEVTNRIQETRRTWFKLQAFWKHTGLSRKWRLRVFDAVIRSKLVYGLETTYLTRAIQRKVDAFQMKGLRQILGMQTTFVNRANTNQRVFEEATKYANDGRRFEQNFIQVRPFSEVIEQRRVTLAGHVLRSDPEDPMRQVSYLPGTAGLHLTGKRRVGRPKQNWVLETNSHIWSNILCHVYPEYSRTDGQNEEIFKAAVQRRF